MATATITKRKRRQKYEEREGRPWPSLPGVDVIDFVLANDPPPHKPYHGEPAPECRQKVLFTGINCLPGQLDMFDTP